MNWFVGEENEDDIITVIIVKTYWIKVGMPVDYVIPIGINLYSNN